MTEQGGGVIEGDGIRIESSEETAEQMIAAVTPKKDEPTKFKAVKDGPPEKEEKPKSAISEAASKLGKKGAQAAAKARAAKGETEETEEPEADKPKEPAESPEDEEDGADGYRTPELKAAAAKRVQEATRKEAEAKREAVRLKAENEELRKARPTPPPPPAERPEARKAPEKPKAEAFENYEDYLDARDAYNRQTWEAEHAEKERQRSEREEVIGKVKTFQEAIRETVAEDPEFWDNVPEIHDSTPLGQLIVRAGAKAPGILRYLGEHPKEYERLSRLDDISELVDGLGVIKGKIEALNEGATAGNPSSDERPGPNPEISRARPPARPVAGAPHIVPGDSKEPDEDAPLSSFVADFRKRKAAASGR